MDTSTLSAYLRDSLSILSACRAHRNSPDYPAYRVAAVQLRLLLCDTTRIHNRVVEISLCARLYPDLRLPPPQREIPGFRLADPPLERPAWLKEVVCLSDGSRLSLREIIRLVCDRDGGAHVDPPAGGLPPALPDWILAMAACVEAEIKRLM